MINSLHPSVFPTTTPANTVNDQPPAERVGEKSSSLSIVSSTTSKSAEIDTRESRHARRSDHDHDHGELYGLVQKLATKLQKSEARNKKLADNLSMIKTLQLQLDDARRLLRAVLWPYHGDYNSKDYMKAIEHVSAMRVELRRQRNTGG